MKYLIVLGGPLTATYEPGVHLLERLKETVKIHKEYDRIIVTGINTQKYPVTEARVMSEWLGKYNIPCIREDCARNTIQNALYTKELVPLKPETTVTVLTNSFHIPRTSLIFVHLWPEYTLRFHSAPTTQRDHTTDKELKNLDYLIKNISIMNNMNTPRPPPLHRAIIAGNIKAVDKLLKNGEDPFIKCEFEGLWAGSLNCFDIVHSIGLPVLQSTIISMMLMKKATKGVCMVRHAETFANVNTKNNQREKSYKIIDSELTEKGKDTIKILNQYICKYNLIDGFDVIITSPLERTIHTCAGMLKGQNQKPVYVDNIVRERLSAHGDIGKPLSVIKELYKNLGQNFIFDFTEEKWWYNPENNHPECNVIDVESNGHVAERVKRFAEKITHDKKYLIFTHGAFIRVSSGKIVENCEVRLFL